ncbi:MULTISPECIES: TatA/E family twin arginine-targeting protein translocase [Prochlorococcus]|uniref:Sec-independent protein secretion pathway component TatA n=1 Tax=Prochlorococcus marinus (strain SARG / CCMP1375 / SS120) TaxID=167539 RepID=Q7VB68_PROMA|nr:MULTISPECIES: TatA/E family twin arginine-targeting protein translocase [Prochlorococcus]AAQ00275.1 Sec-independent protein secretion pathway component TatA [Prochlorococcus marinus subsp. marinus str. CCMP1375]KGG20748.1 Twin-arginine translocation protein TatA [Prochlorococcus marinus str. SS2]KGG25149.1 Twin-arginine translocation protein TatA [Prochlorococcus marinus str. SS35]KGG33299.1 Twin-arginine translocation protein TatA [Prochlorococcus marinus str. SS51]KGG35594.1 Twin-arginine
MNIFGVGLPEIAVIAVLGLIIFGPKRLPEFGRMIGKTVKSLQKASLEFEDEVNRAINDEEPNNKKNTNTSENVANSVIDINNKDV